MRRRAFITLLGGAAAAWPLTARAQTAKLPTIGLWGPTTPSVGSQRVAPFVQRLRELGWIEGRTVAIIPYGGFSPIRLEGWHVGQHLPTHRPA
jgi:putative ABC transport system substrate-binding protein